MRWRPPAAPAPSPTRPAANSSKAWPLAVYMDMLFRTCAVLRSGHLRSGQRSRVQGHPLHRSTAAHKGTVVSWCLGCMAFGDRHTQVAGCILLRSPGSCHQSRRWLQECNCETKLTFHAVREKVLPADPRRTTRSAMPGRLRMETCLCPANTRCSYTSSAYPIAAGG